MHLGRTGDIVIVHTACRKVGPVLGGPNSIIAALRDAAGPVGTIMAYLDWDAPWEDFADDEGRIPEALKPAVPGVDPALTCAARDNGTLPEFLRTTPGVRRSRNPGASVAALGAKADRLTVDHPLDYGYGPGTPQAKLVEAGGKVLMLGRRVLRREVPFATAAGTVWQMVEGYDTGDPVVDALPEDFIAQAVLPFAVARLEAMAGG